MTLEYLARLANVTSCLPTHPTFLHLVFFLIEFPASELDMPIYGHVSPEKLGPSNSTSFLRLFCGYFFLSHYLVFTLCRDVPVVVLQAGVLKTVGLYFQIENI